MPALAENRTVIELKTAKPTGLGITQLGVPVAEGTEIKKGKLHEFIQLRDDGAAGRRYQNLRVTGVKASEGGVESAKLFVQFEVFGDDNVPLAGNSGFGAALCAGGETLLELAPAPAFLPYARAWFENQFVFEVPVALFERADGVAFIARPDEVRLI